MGGTGFSPLGVRLVHHFVLTLMWRTKLWNKMHVLQQQTGVFFSSSLCLKAEAAFINYWFTERSRVGTQSENNKRPKESGEI